MSVEQSEKGLIVFLFGRQGGGGICFNYFSAGALVEQGSQG